MRKSVFLLWLLASVLYTSAQQKSKLEELLVPIPVSVTEHNGSFQIDENLTIHVSTKDADVRRVADFMASKLRTATGYKIPVSETKSRNGIELLLTRNAALGDEGYTLEVRDDKVTISAQKPAGLFYGMQTLFQLMPKEIEGNAVAKNVKWSVPACSISDIPRFAWRGLMFDVVRHFFTKEDVKLFIDEMVKYKFNMLHLHLTDDEGWRIEIKSLPKLTEVGAWNVKKEGYFGAMIPPAKDAKYDDGGFYTHDDIREIVQYAQDRFVNILPEVDVPGHSLAAVASYPELSCTKEAVNYRVRSGEQIIDWSRGLPPYALVDNTLCPANENVYEFLDKVFTEVASLFPFEYIHIGGDECSKNFWEQSDAVKALMKREKLKNMEEVQSYFISRVGKIVESKGKKFIGWDEIMEGGLAPGAAVMSWRGMKGGIEAAKMNRQVVMTPTDFVYLDYVQGDEAIEPHVYASLSLKKTYQFDPLPPGIDPKFIKGGQGNLWTEQIFNNRHRQYMLWPRGMAVAEAVWSPMNRRSWDSFVKRVETQLPRFDASNTKYAPSMFEPRISIAQDKDGKLKVTLTTEVEDLKIHYSFDNSFPDQYYPAYSSVLTVPEDAAQLRLVTYRGDKQLGRLITISIDDLKKRLPKK